MKPLIDRPEDLTPTTPKANATTAPTPSMVPQSSLYSVGTQALVPQQAPQALARAARRNMPLAPQHQRELLGLERLRDDLVNGRIVDRAHHLLAVRAAQQPRGGLEPGERPRVVADELRTHQLGVARIAGIQAGKRTGELIPVKAKQILDSYRRWG